MTIARRQFLQLAGAMRRREFITLFGGAAVAWPLAARAQQRERVPRVGVLFNLPPDDQETQARLTALVQGLQELGWTDRRNIRIVTRWGTDDDQLRNSANDLMALAPNVIVANSNPVVWAVRRASRDVRIVFTASTDPVAGGIVESLARPGGNATGFISAEYGMSAKWLELSRRSLPA